MMIAFYKKNLRIFFSLVLLTFSFVITGWSVERFRFNNLQQPPTIEKTTPTRVDKEIEMANIWTEIQNVFASTPLPVSPGWYTRWTTSKSENSVYFEINLLFSERASTFAQIRKKRFLFSLLNQIYDLYKKADGRIDLQEIRQQMQKELLLIELIAFFQKRKYQNWTFADGQITVQFADFNSILKSVDGSLEIKGENYNLTPIFTDTDFKGAVPWVFGRKPQIQTLINALVVDGVNAQDLIRTLIPNNAQVRQNFWTQELKPFISSSLVSSLRSVVNSVVIDEITYPLNQLLNHDSASETDFPWTQTNSEASRQFHLLFDKVVSVDSIKTAMQSVYWKNLREQFKQLQLVSQFESAKSWLVVDQIKIGEGVYSLDLLISLRDQTATKFFSDPNNQSGIAQLEDLFNNGITVAQIVEGIENVYWSLTQTVLNNFAFLPDERFRFAVNGRWTPPLALNELSAIKAKPTISASVDTLAHAQLRQLIARRVHPDAIENQLLNFYWYRLKNLVAKSKKIADSLFLRLNDKEYSLSVLTIPKIFQTNFTVIVELLTKSEEPEREKRIVQLNKDLDAKKQAAAAPDLTQEASDELLAQIQNIESDLENELAKGTPLTDTITLVKEFAKQFSLAQVKTMLLMRQEWPQLKLFFEEYHLLSFNSVSFNNQVYSLVNLWNNRDFTFADQDFASTLQQIGESAFATELSQLVNSGVTVQQLRNEVTAMMLFWTNLRKLLNDYNFVAPNLTVTIGDRSYFLGTLLAQKSYLAVFDLSQEAKAAFVTLWNDAVELSALESTLALKNAFQQLATTFFNYSGIALFNLTIKGKIYNVERIFYLLRNGDSLEQIAGSNVWANLLQNSPSAQLLTDFVNSQFTTNELTTALNQTNRASQQLLGQLQQLLSFWPSETKLINFAYANGANAFRTPINIAKLIAEIGLKQKITWQQIVDSTKKFPYLPQFITTLNLLSDLVAYQSGNRFFQLLFWKPVQIELNQPNALTFANKVVINEKSYDITTFLKEKAQTDSQLLGDDSTKLLQTLITDKITPAQFKTALQRVTPKPKSEVTPKPKVETTTATNEKQVLSISLAVAGGTVFLGSVGALVYWFVKLRK